MLLEEFLDLEVGDRVKVVSKDSPDYGKVCMVTQLVLDTRQPYEKFAGVPFKIYEPGYLVHVRVLGEGTRRGVLEPNDHNHLEYIE